MSSMEDRILKIEKNTTEEIRENIKSLKEEVIESIKEDMHSLVDKRNNELEERRRRDHNLVYFNLSEHQCPTGEENKKEDENDVINIASQLGLDNLQITAAYRLGKKLDSKTRPLKVILESKSHRKFLLDNAKNIPSKVRHCFKNVFIVKDMTQQQRTECKSRFQADRRRKRRDIDENERESEMDGINNHGSPAAMATGHQMPSPVFRSPINALSQGNMYSGSQNMTFSSSQPYNEETVIMINENETTLTGITSQEGLMVSAGDVTPQAGTRD